MQVQNILIVDDDEDDSEFFTMVVNQIDPDIKVRVASSKDELFKHLRNIIPDLLFIDSFIQNHSGVTSIGEIRNDINFRHMPVIMYTGASDMKNIVNAFNAGASAYIVKPHTIEEIREVLQIVLNKNWNQLDIPKQYYIDKQFVNLLDKDAS